ncbi:MAG: helix-turn-helix transcriptional regulator [Bacteroidota bacterium]
MGRAKGVNIGEFEELVLLIIGILDDQAYGVSIRNAILQETKRNVNISAVHEVLKRLERKGFVESKIGGTTEARGGRRKKLFFMTTEGKQVLEHTTALRNSLYVRIPGFSLP